ncbi:MAG: lysophospholipid acyltransferase family protein [Elusimicrobiota bacterium]
MVREFLLSSLARLYINLVCFTSKNVFLNKQVVEEEYQNGKNVVYAFWHGRQAWLVHSHREKGIVVMTSLSRDGDIQAKIMSGFGYNIVRGSSTRGGVHALREMVRDAGKYDIAFAVDGPRGPVDEVKSGVIVAARLLKRKIIPVTTAVKKKVLFKKAWDLYQLPLLFNYGVVFYGNPVTVTKEDDINTKTVELQNELKRITQLADEVVNTRNVMEKS